jgi:hypothetical protein
MLIYACLMFACLQQRRQDMQGEQRGILAIVQYLIFLISGCLSDCQPCRRFVQLLRSSHQHVLLLSNMWRGARHLSNIYQYDMTLHVWATHSTAVEVASMWSAADIAFLLL